MRRGFVALFSILLLATACGTRDETGSTETLPPATALQGAGWIGEPVMVEAEGDHLRVVAFFKPGCLACQHEARVLNGVRRSHEELVVVGVTASEDQKAISNFREVAAADYPMLYGLTPETMAAYGVTYFPTVRIIDREGRIVARDLGYLEDAEER